MCSAPSLSHAAHVGDAIEDVAGTVIIQGRHGCAFGQSVAREARDQVDEEPGEDEDIEVEGDEE